MMFMIPSVSHEQIFSTLIFSGLSLIQPDSFNLILL